ncbi:hypothetical protein ACFZC3_15220 [Streptomyces sp. NPDC007903]|uniref:hypothetical protein n=1 Tax=Streptomyces sp. NPDC007903 TaxID=3364786 RepID=UPI0036E4B400
MIENLFLGAGAAGVVGVVYWAGPAARGAHRYVVPRAVLRAEAARSSAAADEMAGALLAMVARLHHALSQRNDALRLLHRAETLVEQLDEQVADRQQLAAEVIRLRAALANATAVRPLACPDDDASALPDLDQEWTDTTRTAWTARTT